MKPIRSIAMIILSASRLAAVSCFAQGSLPPPGPPGETMKSLQEIWDRIGALETQNQQLTNLLLQTSQAAGTLPWSATQLDGDLNFGSAEVGEWCSLKFSPSGQPAISYYDRINGDLKFAQFNGATWTVTTVDSTGDTGRNTSLAFTPGGQPAISYFKNGPSFEIKYVEFDGTTWLTPVTIETVGFPGTSGADTSLAFTPGGQPAISYFSVFQGLRYSEFDGGAWSAPITVEGGSAGVQNSLAFGPSGVLSIAYDTVGSGLKFAELLSPGNWRFSTVEATMSGVGNVSLAFTPAGQPAIGYGLSAVKYARSTGVQSFVGGTLRFWNVSTVDSVSSRGHSVSLAFSAGGQPALSYYNLTGGDLMFAIFNGVTWTTATVDSAGDVGNYTSLAFTPTGQPAIAYHDVFNKDLKYAVRTPFVSP